MSNKKLTALIIIVVVFTFTFYWAFLSFDTANPIVTLLAFVLLLAGTVAALAIGNSGAR